MSARLPYRLLNLALIGATAAAFVWLAQHASTQPRLQSDASLQIVLPVFSETLLAGGDRYLAANVGMFRAMMAPLDRDAGDTLIAARIHEGVSWQNPAHGDNYYVAAAMLSAGQTEIAQSILQRATEARPYDMLPPFYYAFNRYYYLHDPVEGARYMAIAAQHARDMQTRASLERISARWYSRGVSNADAADWLEMLAGQTRLPAQRNRFLRQAQAYRILDKVRDALKTYQARHGGFPATWEELVGYGAFKKEDAFPDWAKEFELGKDNVVMVSTRRK